MPRFEAVREVIRQYYLRWIYFPLVPGARPRYFEAPWQYPTYTLDGFAGAEEGQPAKAPDLLFYPMTDWHSRTQRSQQLPRAFAALGHRSFYLNPHLGRHFRRPISFDRAHRVSLLEPRVVEVHVRLAREPVFHHRLLREDEAEEISRSLLRLTGKRQTVQIVSLPFWLAAAERVRNQAGHPIVYDCHDLLNGFARIAPEIVKQEADLFRTADLVFFSSEQLRETKLRADPDLADRSLLIRNGVDASMFQFQAEARAVRRTVGYVGALESWFDTAALAAAAAKHRECRFILVGRVDSRIVESLRRLPNVELRGEVPYSEVPPIMASFDCGLIPFVRNPLTLATNPIKLYEYFSSGIPVAATSIPEIDLFGDLVYTARTPDEFAGCVARALAEDDTEKRRARRAIAERESWAARAQAMLDTFRSLPWGVR